MMSVIVRFALVVVVVTQLLSPCESLRSRGYGSGKYDSQPKSYPKTYMGTSSGLPAQNATRRGLGISAWGIVAVIMSVILAGMGFYYFTMCYPILCKKERKYDMIGLPSVA